MLHHFRNAPSCFHAMIQTVASRYHRRPLAASPGPPQRSRADQPPALRQPEGLQP
jgi:hypothetical protein